MLNNPKVMLLPHIGTATYETQREMEMLVLENVKSCLTQAKMVTLVPEQEIATQMNGSNGHCSYNGNI